MTAATTYFETSNRRLTVFDLALIAVFLLGLYLGVSLQITSKIPLTCAPSGFAGLILLWRRRDDMQPRHLAGLLGVVALYLVWILIATDLAFLSKRFTGLVQLTYGLVIGYGMFLTLLRAEDATAERANWSYPALAEELRRACAASPMSSTKRIPSSTSWRRRPSGRSRRAIRAAAPSTSSVCRARLRCSERGCSGGIASTRSRSRCGCAS